MRPLKFNKTYTPAKHFNREIAYSFCTIFMGTLWEAFFMYLYAIGYVTNYFMDMREN